MILKYVFNTFTKRCPNCSGFIFVQNQIRPKLPPINITGDTLSFARTSTKQTRAFSVIGLCVWHGLPLALLLLPRIHSEKFYSNMKTVLISHARFGSAFE